MKGQLMIFISNATVMVINILCILGIVEIEIVKCCVLISTLSVSFFNCFIHKGKYQKEKSTPKKTIFELILFCVVIGNFLTFFVALMLNYN